MLRRWLAGRSLCLRPGHITFDLLPGLEKKVRDRKERHRLQCELALREFDAWWARAGEEMQRSGVRVQT